MFTLLELVEFESLKFKSSTGVRLQDAEYSPEYVEILRAWMRTSGNADFEDQLLKEGLISLEIKNAELGYDFLMEAMSPQDELAFESGVIKFVPLDPEDQLSKRFKNEAIREEKRERWAESAGLTRSEWSSLSLSFGSSENFEVPIEDYSPAVLKLTEPPFAEIFRNPPCTLEISHLRKLREDGRFDREPNSVQIAAYLYSKWNWTQQEIEQMFSNLTTWSDYESGKARVKRILKQTWPDRFERMLKVLDACTERQREAFQVYYDIDLRPTLVEAASSLQIDRSSLNERLLNIRNKFRDEFSEFSHLKPNPRSWSEEYDLVYDGFYRKSAAMFYVCRISSSRTGETDEVFESRFSKLERAGTDRSKIYEWLRLRRYDPGLKTVLAGSSRGTRMKRGEFFHHPKAWKDWAMREALADV